MCIANIKTSKLEIKENKGSYHLNQGFWNILQKFRGFKLICKHYFMHKVKKEANIIIQTNTNELTY